MINTMQNNENLGPPVGFAHESEHPIVSMPFMVKIDGEQFEGQRISLTEIETVSLASTMKIGEKSLATLCFPFKDFTIQMTAMVTMKGQADVDTTVLLFSEPTGGHFPQLRYLINSYISGDVVSLNGMMGYSGPTQFGASGPPPKRTIGSRIWSLCVSVLSLLAVLSLVYFLLTRFTTSVEAYPVLIDQSGKAMQATTAGQLTYMNADAPTGEVIYTITSNTGDVLNFQKLQAGEVVIGSDIVEGVTVLPDDTILTILDPDASLRLTTLISMEGMVRVFQGDLAEIELPDGRIFPVEVELSNSTRSAYIRGDDFVPVILSVEEGSLTEADVNQTAVLRLSKKLFAGLSFNSRRDQ